MFNDYFYTRLQYLLPQHLLSRLAGIVSSCRISVIKNWLIDEFIRRYKVDLSAAVESDPHQYVDFNSFFTRALKPEARPIVQDKDAVVCPVDGSISQLGNIQVDYLPQAKRFTYDLLQLLGGSEERAAPFLNGSFITLYLAPKDYHRVHMPLTGQLQEMIYIPGRLFSVNSVTANGVPNLFARNERVVSLFSTEAGPMAVILIGAMLVASISTVWSGMVTPLTGQKVHVWKYGEQIIKLERGNELGHFQLGSTVIILFGYNKVQWTTEIQTGQAVQLGQRLGMICDYD